MEGSAWSLLQTAAVRSAVTVPACSGSWQPPRKHPVHPD